MQALYVRDEVLEAFRDTCKAKKSSAVQPIGALPYPKGLIRDVLLSVTGQDHGRTKEAQDGFWQLARFQKLTSEQAELVEAWERSRDFPGGSAQSYEEHVALLTLNGEMNSVIEQERATSRAELAQRLSGQN